MVKIPINDIESASKLVFNIEFPKLDPNEKASSQSEAAVQEPSPTAPPRKRTKLTSQNSDSGSIMEKAKRNRTRLNGICLAVMELGNQNRKFPTYLRNLENFKKSLKFFAIQASWGGETIYCGSFFVFFCLIGNYNQGCPGPHQDTIFAQILPNILRNMAKNRRNLAFNPSSQKLPGLMSHAENGLPSNSVLVIFSIFRLIGNSEI